MGIGPFGKVESNRPPRSLFDLSHEKKLTCDMFQLIPVLNMEMMPGDTFKVQNEVIVRMAPLITPVLHEIYATVHYFFVPYRILWDQWEEFITGGVEGDDDTAIPLWKPTVAAATGPGTIWDFLGNPSVDTLPYDDDQAMWPIDLHKRAYIKIFNDFYRDQNLIGEIELNSSYAWPFNRAYEKDYFTSSLPWQQRGVAPALPISGFTHADFSGTPVQGLSSVTGNVYVPSGSPDATIFTVNPSGPSNLRTALSNNTVDLSEASAFDIADLRLAFQIQRFLERNARAGVRYTEFLKSHFGTSPRDDRLQRPEYLGGSKSPIIISEVLQTGSSDTTSPQGNMAGHGLSADRNFITNYTAQEFGVIMGIMSICPKPAYQQGINRQLLRRTRYDFPFPEFVNLSEQEIYNGEIYWSSDSHNEEVFGFQGRYDELRYYPNSVHGLFRTDLNFWHLGRIFSNRPLLNEAFITGNPTDTKRIFAVPSEPGFLVAFGNIIRAVRPLPAFNTPGLIDHG